MTASADMGWGAIAKLIPTRAYVLHQVSPGVGPTTMNVFANMGMHLAARLTDTRAYVQGQVRPGAVQMCTMKPSSRASINQGFQALLVIAFQA